MILKAKARALITVRRWTQTGRDRSQKVIGRHVNVRRVEIHDFDCREVAKDFVGRTEGPQPVLIIYDLHRVENDNKLIKKNSNEFPKIPFFSFIGDYAEGSTEYFHIVSLPFCLGSRLSP